MHVVTTLLSWLNIVDNVVHVGQLNVVHVGQLNVVHVGQLNVVHVGQLNVHLVHP